MKCQHCGAVGDESDGISGVTLYNVFCTLSCNPCYNEFMVIVRGDGNCLNWETQDARMKILHDAVRSGGPNQSKWMDEYVNLRVEQFKDERSIIRTCKEFYSGEEESNEEDRYPKRR